MICAVSTNYASCQVFVSGICSDLLIPTNFPELCLTKGSTGMRHDSRSTAVGWPPPKFLFSSESRNFTIVVLSRVHAARVI